MSNETGKSFQEQVADIANMVQGEADAARGGAAPGSTPGQPQQFTQAPAVDPQAQAAAQPSQAAPSGEGAQKLLLGKFKTEDEATRAHHLLIHSLNQLKAENDALKAAKPASAPVIPTTTDLSPGRVDPTAEDEKWRTGYGIDPADLDARIEARARILLEQQNAPMRAMQAAEQYIVTQYPDFPAKVDDVRAFVAANPAVDARVKDLHSRGLYAEAMEIGYLAYDNALRVFNSATAAATQTANAIDADRAAGSLIAPQGGGPRETLPQAGGFPTSREQWEEIERLKANGQDAEVRRRLYGHMIAGIPALNGGRAR